MPHQRPLEEVQLEQHTLMSCCAFANASSLLNDCLKASFLASISENRGKFASARPEVYGPVGDVEEPSLRKSAIPEVVTERTEVNDRVNFRSRVDNSPVTIMGAGESKPQQATDYYEILQVDENATAEEIKVSFFDRKHVRLHLQPPQKSFRRLAMIHHPDKNTDDVDGATQRFTLIQQAYEVWEASVILPLRRAHGSVSGAQRRASECFGPASDRL